MGLKEKQGFPLGILGIQLAQEVVAFSVFDSCPFNSECSATHDEFPQARFLKKEEEEGGRGN